MTIGGTRAHTQQLRTCGWQVVRQPVSTWFHTQTHLYSSHPFFSFCTTKMAATVETLEHAIDTLTRCRLHQPSSKYSLWEACEVLMCTSALITVCSSNNTIFIWCFELLESNFHITATPLHSICFNKGSFVVYTGTYQVSVETWLSSFPEYGASADTGSITGKCHQIK